MFAAKEKPPKAFPLQKKQKARLPSEDEPIGLSRGKTFFGNPAIRATHARGDRGPVALRPRISPGLLLSEATCRENKAFPLSKAIKKLLHFGSFRVFNATNTPGTLLAVCLIDIRAEKANRREQNFHDSSITREGHPTLRSEWPLKGVELVSTADVEL